MPNSKDALNQSFRGRVRNRKVATQLENDKSGRVNTIEVVRTSITTVTKKIEIPEDASEVIIYHDTPGVKLYIGKDGTISASSNSAPLAENQELHLKIKPGVDLNFYGIASTGTITVYAIGKYNG